MEDLIDLIATDGSPSDISDAVKQLLYTKSAEKIDSFRPEVASIMFDDNDQTGDNE
jgi:hypothetical protein